MLEISKKVGRVVASRKLYYMFSSNFSGTVIALFKEASVIAYACAYTNPFSYSLRPYINACIALSVARSGNATTILLN